MNELTPAEQHLANQLQRQASALDVGDTAIASVVRRGRQRRERRRVAVGVVAVVTLSGTVIGTIQLLSTPVTHRIKAATDSAPGETDSPDTALPGTDGSEPTTPVNRVDSNLVWNVVTPGSTEALGGSFWNTAGISQSPPYLAWSTSPGKTSDVQFLPTLYRSDDGIHWTASGGESFTQPQVSARGTGNRNGRMFAFGTAAANAPIPNGGGGEVVVDVSDDQGASWRNIILPIDLRGLASSKGVQGVGFQGGMAAGNAGVVAIAVPNLLFDVSVQQRFAGGMIPRRDGALPVTYTNCGNITDPTIPAGAKSSTASTTTMVGAAPGNTAPAETGPPPSPTTIFAGYWAAAPNCTSDTSAPPPAVIPWSDLGVDPAAVAATFTPRVFVSTDGEHFVEGAFPALPDGYMPAQFRVVATPTGFAAAAQLYDANTGGGVAAKLYTSTDGLSWTESDMPAGQYDSINFLPNGTVVAFANAMPGSPSSNRFTAVSTDGVEWSKMSLDSLLDPADGKSPQLDVWQAAAGPAGITVSATISTDAAIEAGGLSVDRDGVRLTITSFRDRTFIATDIASGGELGRLDQRVAPAADSAINYDGNGQIQVLATDGSVRAKFTEQDMIVLNQQQSVSTSKSVLLHSTDGINWSRDDVKTVAGFDGYGTSRVQVTASNVLVSMVDPNTHDAQGILKTVVLVGTPKG